MLAVLLRRDALQRKRKEGRLIEMAMEEQAKRTQSTNRSAQIALIILAALAAGVLLVDLLVLKLPVLPVILIVIIEVAMAFFMQRVPLWLHGIVVAGEIVLGILTGQVVCLLLGSALYFYSVLAFGMVLYGQRKRRVHPA